MSYEAGRWARAHTLVLDQDSTALAVLKELADDYRDNDRCCRIDSYKELALYLGIKKPDTVRAAVARLSTLGLVSASNIIVGRCVVGTRFELVGYRKSDWPADRQGKPVWVEVAVSFGMEPQSWWPKLNQTEKADVPQKTGDPRKTDNPKKSGDLQKSDLGHPKNGGGVTQKTGEGTPKNGFPYTHIRHIRQITNRYVLSAPEKNSTDETSCLETNPNTAPIDDVPFPDFEEPTSEELFNAPLVDEAKPRDEPQPEAKPKAPKTTRGTRLTIKTLPDEWRAWMAKHFPKYDPDLVFAGFHDYWIGVSGAKGVKLDWFATFRNHVRGIPEWKQKNFIKKDCEQETLPNSNEWTQARRLREGYGWATTY